MTWSLYSGEPNRMKAHRCVRPLVKAKLLRVTRAGYYKLTAEGEKELQDVMDETDKNSTSEQTA